MSSLSLVTAAAFILIIPGRRVVPAAAVLRPQRRYKSRAHALHAPVHGVLLPAQRQGVRGREAPGKNREEPRERAGAGARGAAGGAVLEPVPAPPLSLLISCLNLSLSLPFRRVASRKFFEFRRRKGRERSGLAAQA